jgi:hypothetical protein
VYAGVTGMDRAAQAQAAGAEAQAAPTNAEPLLFAASEGRHYHRRHDCNELQMCSNVRSGNAYHFTVNEHKSRCPMCCGSPAQQTCGTAPAAPAASAPASGSGGGYAGPTPEEAERYRRQQERRRHEEERAAAAIAAAQRARYAGPTAQERARYGYMNGAQPTGKPPGGVDRVVHSMGGVSAALYGSAAAKASPSRPAHPLAGLSRGGGMKASGAGVPNVRLGLGPELDELLRRAAGAGFVVV